MQDLPFFIIFMAHTDSRFRAQSASNPPLSQQLWTHNMKHFWKSPHETIGTPPLQMKRSSILALLAGVKQSSISDNTPISDIIQ